MLACIATTYREVSGTDAVIKRAVSAAPSGCLNYVVTLTDQTRLMRRFRDTNTHHPHTKCGRNELEQTKLQKAFQNSDRIERRAAQAIVDCLPSGSMRRLLHQNHIDGGHIHCAQTGIERMRVTCRCCR